MADKKRNLLNLAFAAICLAILAVLFLAPEETTPFLPHDQVHEPMHQIANKKEAEASCLKCHDQGAEAPLPEEHPPKFRCLFCHKRQ